MSQPIWKFVANLGDVTPLEYDGYFVYEDTTGEYGFEAERLTCLESGKYEIRRVCLDRCKLATLTDEQYGAIRSYLVPYGYDPATYPLPVHRYEEWFADSLVSVASFIGSTVQALRQDLCSEDGTARALAYQAIGDYHGWDNLDSYPLTLTRDEVIAHYKQGELE